MSNSGVSIATHILNAFNDEGIKEIIDQKEWMKDDRISIRLITKQKEFENYIDFLIEKGLCALDLETTGLNTRLKKNGEPYVNIVGICLASSSFEGAYVPVKHTDKEYNIPTTFVVRELKRLCSNCRCIYHNFKYDGEVLRNHGIEVQDENAIEDTMLMAHVEDASRKEKGLKSLSENLLKRSMLEIDKLGVETNKKGVVSFDMVPPPKALYYGAPDALNTFGLFKYFEKRLNIQDPNKKAGPWAIYKLEKKCVFVTMEMERNYVLIDKEYLIGVKSKVEERLEKIRKSIYEMAGRHFDLDSPKQLGVVLFDEMKCKYPLKEKSATGQYITNAATLEKIKDDYPIISFIVKHRELEKILGTYIENFIKNTDEDNMAKFQLNQVRADTGRYSSGGSGKNSGLRGNGYCGVNCQNIPSPNEDDPESINLRRAIIARPGYKIVSIDYSGEELRIAANFSREPKWIDEFLNGTGDLHSITGRIIFQKNKISKNERKLGKTLNFLTMYGGGAGGFAAQAKVPYDTAKKMILNFFRGYKTLKKWIDAESKICRKRGYSKTAFGRRRPLHNFYNSGDDKIKAKGDRCAINSKIQGTGADIGKIAAYRVWKWIHDNGFEEDVRILFPVHDEIVYEVKEDKLDFYIPEICQIMVLNDLIKKLDWSIPLDVDAEYGDSFSVTNDYWKEKEKSNPLEPAEEATKKKEILPESDTESSSTIKSNPTPETKTDIKVDAAPKEAVETPNVAHKLEGAVGDSHFYQFSINLRDALVGDRNGEKDAKKIFDSENPEDSAPDEAVFKNAQIKKMIDDQGYLSYPLDVDYINAQQLKTVIEILASCNDSLIGPKCKLCLLNRDGEIWYKTRRKVSVDAFIALVLWLNI